MQRFALVVKEDELSQSFAPKIKQALLQAGFIFDKDQPELVLALGGDGTFLRAVDQYLNQIESILFLPIHTGTLGFFSEYTIEELDQLMADLTHLTPTKITKRLLEIRVFKDDVTTYYAVNEGRIENIIHTQIMDVYINDEYFETFRGTGLCVSTQLGSTAYNRSLGGAVMLNDLELLQLTEITGIHHRLFRSLRVPLILNAQTKITLKSTDFNQAFLGWDAHTIDLKDTRMIECRLSEREIAFARYRPDKYFSKLTHLF